MIRALALLVLVACSDKSGDDTQAAVEANTEIQFAARVGDQDFNCGTTYAAFGSTATSYTPADLRFYVHDVALLNDAGDAEPAVIVADGLWQLDPVVLLDFEDGSGPCDNGNADKNSVVRAYVPEGSYSGLRFKVGVPFDENHQDATTAGSPLNLSSMYWGWQGGYKFIRLEGASTGNPDGNLMHLGSTGCSAEAGGQVSGCDYENIATVTLAGFDAAASTVVLDLAALMADVDLDASDDSADGTCMSSVDDTDCVGPFSALGLAYGEMAADPDGQTAFHVE